MTEKLLTITDLHKRFGDVEVIKGVSLSVGKGEVACIIGPSGSGKSTLIRCVNALVAVRARLRCGCSGIEVNDPKLDKLKLRKHVGMVFQQYNLFPASHRAAERDDGADPGAETPARRSRSAKPAPCSRKLRLEGKEHAYPGELPAASSSASPSPVPRHEAGSDVVRRGDRGARPGNRQRSPLTIRQLAEEGMTCVLVTHEMGFAREVANEIYFTDRGVIVEHGPPSQFFSAPRDPRTKAFLSQIL